MDGRALGGAPFVCFDLGEILVRIRHRWMECAEAAGVVPARPASADMHLTQFRPFVDFQDGQLSLAEYLRGLSDLLGIDSAGAAGVHDAIVRDMMPATHRLVLDIVEAGIDTGCLSNTNEPHWRRLLSDDFPNVQALRVKVASHEVGASKPDPAIFEAFEQASGHQPTDILMFDDTEENVIVAKSRGWTGVWIPRGAPVATIVRKTLEDRSILKMEA